MDPRCLPQNPVASNSNTGQSIIVPVTPPSWQSRGERQQRGEMTPSSSQQSLRSFITTTRTPSPANLSPGYSHHAPLGGFLELARDGDYAGLLQLLSSGEDAVQSRDQRTAEGDSALHEAASRGYIKAVIVLVGVIAVNTPGYKLRTPLHLAALNGHRLVAVSLVRDGAKVNAIDSDGFTPMALAARNNHTRLVEDLLRKKAKIDEKAMVMAANNCNWDLIGTFLRKTRGLQDTCDERGDPLIVIASRNLRWDTVKLLLEKGASPTKCRIPGETALMYATKYHEGEIVDLLMRTEAKYNTEQLQYAFGKNCGGRIKKDKGKASE